PRIHHRRPAARRLLQGGGRAPRGGVPHHPQLRGPGAVAAHRPGLDRRHRPLRRVPPPRGTGGPAVTLPLLGPMTLSGFAHSWYLFFLFAAVGLAALYIVLQLARQRRMLRFANMELLESVAPQRPSRWRHLPAILLVLS